MGLVIGNTYYIKNITSGKYLNVYGTDTVANERNVNVYAKEDCLAQKWVVRLAGNGARVLTTINEAYSLNINTSSNNCSMYAVASNTEADSVVDFLTVDASQNMYKIQMMAHSKYLAVDSSSDNAYWSSDSDGLYTIWQLEDVNAAVDTPDPVPSAIADQTFFVKCYGTDYNLNVYGNDTVANNTNVTVYGKENVLAQKWVAKDTTAGPKLFTKIDENFCLDIYTPNSNCDMYTASAGDEDTVIEFEPYNETQKIYRIKMFKHDKYLCADTLSDGGNVSWSSSSSGNTLWQFVSEEDMFPTPDTTPTAIKDKPFFVKNYSTGFNLNVYGSDTVANSRNVNVYSKENVLAQKWVAKDTSAGPKLFTKINETFALNIHEESSNNCTMYTAVDNDNDSVLEFVPYNESLGLYRIKMFNHNKYLTVDGTESGANAYWSTADTYSLWQFVDEDTMFPPAPGAPAEIVDKTFFLQAGDSAYYLNVHGSDTVVDTRNVDVFSLENCLAQRWVARGSEQNPKLHTKIDETFALNIYNNDCTMYTAEGNDTDSILEFIKVDTLQYKIKMYHHNKYLAVNGTPGIGVDVIWVESADAATVWKFIDESDLDLPEGSVSETFTANSSLVTTVIPAHTNNFTVGRAANGGTISEICIHHAAGNITVNNLGALWQNPNRAGSSHYGVNGTQVGQYVKESDIAWTNGHWESNKRSVSIETANSTGDPDWLVSDETLDTLIKLVADIARRNCLGILAVGTNLTYHSMYSATLCPGPYILSKMEYIAEESNKINNEYLSDIVYIRKHNTEYFLGIGSNNNIILTDMDSAAPWKISGQSNSCTILSANDPTLSLQNNNGIPVISSAINSSAYGVLDSLNKLSIFSTSSANARTTTNNYTLSIVNGIPEFKTDDTEIFDVMPIANTEKSHILPSEIADDLNINKFYFIKSGEQYLTFENGSFYLKNIANKNDIESQFWKVISANDKFRIDGYSILSNALGMHELYNSCVSRPLSDYNSNNISIIKNSATGKYCIRHNTYGKYLYPDILCPFWRSIPKNENNEEMFCWNFDCTPSVLFRETTPPSKIDDNSYILASVASEKDVEYHPSCGFENGFDFDTSPIGERIVDILDIFAKQVFDAPEKDFSREETCYYLYGEREDPKNGKYRYHTGVDISYGEDPFIHALYGGIVTYSNFDDFGTVSIYVPELNIVTSYVHMKNLTDFDAVDENNIPLFSKDENGRSIITAGTILGQQAGKGGIGTSITAYPNHLHFEVSPYTNSTEPSDNKYKTLVTEPSSFMKTIIPYAYMDGII